MNLISMAIAAIFSSLVFCPGASAGSDALPLPVPFQQASFKTGHDVSPSVLSAIQSTDAALNALRNPPFQLVIPGDADLDQQNKPALPTPAPKAAGMFQPLSMLMLGAGMIGLAGFGRRRFKRVEREEA